MRNRGGCACGGKVCSSADRGRDGPVAPGLPLARRRWRRYPRPVTSNRPATDPSDGATAPGEAWRRPGYRRAVRIEPGEGTVRAALEDDLHAMSVVLRHDGIGVTQVTGTMHRAPWTPCPGAEAVLAETFEGVSLAEVTARRDKQRNCTHLHDLAVLAAAHAARPDTIDYRIAVSDASNGERLLEIERDGTVLHSWREQDGTFVAPATLAGYSALTMRDWIAGLAPGLQESARLLQWGSLVAHGRAMTDERRRAALGQRANCFTMQPERVADARLRSGMVDFSESGRELLADINKATV